MAVASGPAALDALAALVGDTPVPASRLLHGRDYLPAGVQPAVDSSPLGPDTEIGGYGNEERYRLHRDAPEVARVVAGPAVQLRAERPGLSAETVQAYLQSSLDLTMQGGTTSGVVYPLAVCELATQFRFRNVGGASAGAIAAALTAAAELGRSEDVRRSTAPEAPEATDAGRAEHRPTAAGVHNPLQVRRGFAGLTDLVGWLTQTRPGDPETDEFRLAQMFRPGPGTQPLFRVVVAAMRQRTWACALLALLAFRWRTRLAAALLIAGTVLLTGWVSGRFLDQPRSWPATAGWGLLGVAAYLVTVVALVLLAPLVPLALGRRASRRDRSPGWLKLLREHTSTFGAPRSETRARLVTGAVLGGIAVTVAVTWSSVYGAGVLVGLAGSLAVLGTLLAAGARWVGQLRSRSFGLLAGTTSRGGTRTLLDRLAGVPASTVELSVVPWLDECLTSLAGLPPGEVLRFGHLWSGHGYRPPRGRSPRGPAELLDLTEMSEQPDRRLVNLELMTTDLTRQRPYRFPLPVTGRDDPDRLWLCLEELEDGDGRLFPQSVLDVLAEGDTRAAVDADGVRRVLHPLPDPWDLPVIFAVRLSMALPMLFQAVRMYRVAVRRPVQDDFGRALAYEDRRLEWPEIDDLAEEVWFSDGGITSNFPVHFFDAPLPRWPTVSLNLGRHPEWGPHQDVSLPQDFDVSPIPVQPLTRSGTSLASGVLDTAMSWRDNMQSAMPGYRNRIAQVRTRADEGGTNLFMPRATVASLALRGALAGARLRTRFADDHQWDRFRWLRLRVAVSNLERLRRSTEQRQGFYADALSGPQWLDEQRAKFCDQPVGATIDWYQPLDDFWPEAPQLLDAVSRAYQPPADPAANPMTVNVPRPEPVLRQVPQE